jgi:diguanylate cyclase (GGDEF)-like protein
LAEIGEKIHSIFRDEDTIAHIGGDEFSVFLTHKIPKDIIDLRARQICEAIKTEYRVAGEIVSTSCSVGVAIAPQHGNSYTQLYKNADKAQYLAKKAGKNKHIIFDSANE